MATTNISINSRLHPTQSYTEAKVLPWYSSLDETCVAGTLVKIVPTAANPSNQAGWSGKALGADIKGTVSMGFETKSKFQPTASGDNNSEAVGIVLVNTQSTDENGLPLKFFPAKKSAMGVVCSGESAPIATDGIFGIWGKYIDQALGAPTPGYAAVISVSGDGIIAVADPANTGHMGVDGSVYQTNQIIGKWVTTTGSEFASFGGYAFLTLS